MVQQPSKSILSKEFVSNILSTAKQLVEEQQPLQPMLFINTGAEVEILPLRAMKPGESKALYMRAIARVYAKQQKLIHEVILISEAWGAIATQGQEGYIRPSQHPNRTEVVMVTGRNRGGSHYTIVLQPFKRHGTVIFWQPIAKETYTAPREEGTYFTGVLDYLFTA